MIFVVWRRKLTSAKIFDVVSGEVIERLESHEEEILCIKAVTFKEENYFVTTSQDGYINKWKMDEDWGYAQLS